MASTKVKGVVLGSVNTKEKDKIVTIFSLEQGKMSLSMRGVRGDKAKMKFAKELFCFAEFVIEEGKAFDIVTAVDVIDSFYSLSTDIDKYYEACAVLDLVNKNSSTEPNHEMFIALIKALKTLCYDDVKKYYVIDKFLLFILKNMGYNFISENCSSCGATLSNRYLNIHVGELVCPACRDAMSVSIPNTAYSAMKILLNTDYEKLPTVNFGGNGAEQAYHILSKNYLMRTGNRIIDII